MKNNGIINIHIFVLLLLHLLLLVITRFIAWPEMLIYPFLLEKGFHFYGDIIQPYLPSLPYVLWMFFKIFGLSVTSLRGITYLWILISDIILLIILRKHFSEVNKYLTFIIYVLLQIFLEGNGIWFDHAVVPFILLSFYFILNYYKESSSKYFLYGCLFVGIALSIKQTAVFLLPLVIIPAIQHKNTRLAVEGFLVILLPNLAWLLSFQKELWWWAVVYPSKIMINTAGYALYPTARQSVVTAIIFLPSLYLFRQLNFIKFQLLLWMVASLGFSFPRFSYFHLQPALPFAVICLGLIYRNTTKTFFKRLLIIYLVVLCLVSSRELSRHLFQPPRFFEPQTYEIADKIRTIIPHEQTVFFYNDMGNIMVIGDFKPVKPWAYTFPWYMKIPGLQEEIIRSINEQTNWVVFSTFKNDGHDVPGSYIPSLIQATIQKEYYIYNTLNSDIQILRRRSL